MFGSSVNQHVHPQQAKHHYEVWINKSAGNNRSVSLCSLRLPGLTQSHFPLKSTMYTCIFIDVYRFYLLRFSLWNSRSLLLEFRQIQISEKNPSFKQQIVSSFKSIVIERVFYKGFLRKSTPKARTDVHRFVFPLKGYTPFSDTTKSHCCLCIYIPRYPKTHDHQLPVLMVN